VYLSIDVFTRGFIKKIFSFNYFEKIHAKEDFNRVFKNGVKFDSEYIKIFIYKRHDGCDVRRLGLITSRKIGGSVVRNKVKRKLREIFRTNKYLLKPGLDLIFISKKNIVHVKYYNLEKHIFDLIKNVKIFLNAG
jgi:ribonuclease P protein component